MTIIIDSIPVVVIDSFFQSYYDTAYHEVTVTDSQQVQYEASSSGRYTEIPLLFGYRIPLGKVRLQLTGGAAYGWYTGAVRYGINSEGQLYSYQPGPVANLIGRVTIQYPISRSLFLQAYTGARYAIGLKKNIPDDNYFLYSFGGGVVVSILNDESFHYCKQRAFSCEKTKNEYVCLTATFLQTKW